MAEYKDLTCVCCGNKFGEDDDIVVCPTCGTPHHRECYKNLGHCANIAWHSENKTYDAENERENIEEQKRKEESQAKEKELQQAPDITCARCGHKNNSQALFCDRCGAPISQGFGAPNVPPLRQGEPPFPLPVNPFAAVDPNEEIDGIPAWKLSAVVRENSMRFLAQFKRIFSLKRKTIFNFAAFMFAPFYFFYRKLYSVGVLTLVLSVLFNLPALILNSSNETLSKLLGMTVSFGIDLTQTQALWLARFSLFGNLALIAMRFLSGLFANWLYFKKCKKLCAVIDKTAQSQQNFKEQAYKKGGVNRAVIIGFIALYIIMVWVATFFMISPEFFGA